MDWYEGLLISGIFSPKPYPVPCKLKSSLFITGTVYNSNTPTLCCLGLQNVKHMKQHMSHFSFLDILTPLERTTTPCGCRTGNICEPCRNPSKQAQRYCACALINEVCGAGIQLSTATYQTVTNSGRDGLGNRNFASQRSTQEALGAAHNASPYVVCNESKGSSTNNFCMVHPRPAQRPW